MCFMCWYVFFIFVGAVIRTDSEADAAPEAAAAAAAVCVASPSIRYR
jgi:hypothetical protein